MLTDLSLNDVSYRLFRLRRLILVAALLPVIPLAMAIFAGVWIGWWVWGLWLIAVLSYTVFFPNGWMDLLCLTLSFGIVVFMSTIFGAMGIGAVIGTILGLVAWFTLWMVLTPVLPMLDRFAFPVEGIEYTTGLPVDLATAKAAFFYRPDAMVGYHECGPLEEGGVFSMTPRYGSDITPHIDKFTLTDDTAAEEFSFLAKVVSRDETTQETVYITDFSREDMDVLTTVQCLEPTANGCLYQKVEAGHGMGLFTGAGFWLNDVDGDVVRAALDAQLERPTPALRSASRDSLLYVVARWFERRRPGPSPAQP